MLSKDNVPVFFKLEDFVPSLRRQFDQHPLDLSKVLRVGVQVKDPEQHPTPVPAGTDRDFLLITDGKEVCTWQAEPLTALFRGNKIPPFLGDYPEAYNDSFALFDMHALEFSQAFTIPRDLEMKEIYSMLRRRPDGKSLGPLHDYMWQAAALVLGTRPLSQAEFEAIMARLERSCKTFALGPGSRNYIATLQSTLGSGD